MLLEFLLKHEVTANTLSELSKLLPNQPHSPGEVVSVLLERFEILITSQDQSYYVRTYGLNYKKDLLTKIGLLISSTNTQDFLPAECALSIDHLTSILLTDVEKFPEYIFKKIFNKFLSPLHKESANAIAQDFSKVLCSISRLVEIEQITSIDEKIILNTFKFFFNKVNKDTPTYLVVNSIWALAKLVEAGVGDSMHPINKDARNMVKTGIQSLINHLYPKLRQMSKTDIIKTLWAFGIINQIVKLNIPCDDIKHFYSFISRLKLHPIEKQQLIMGIGLLELRSQIDIEDLINDCRPTSNLESYQTAPYTSPSDCTSEQEAFLCGFFVDLLVTFADGKKMIYEFDGPHHSTLKQKRFDRFRDRILSNKNYNIVRIPYCNKNSFFSPNQPSKKMTPVTKHNVTQSEKPELATNNPYDETFNPSTSQYASEAGIDDAPWLSAQAMELSENPDPWFQEATPGEVMEQDQPMQTGLTSIESQQDTKSPVDCWEDYEKSPVPLAPSDTQSNKLEVMPPVALPVQEELVTFSETGASTDIQSMEQNYEPSPALLEEERLPRGLNAMAEPFQPSENVDSQFYGQVFKTYNELDSRAGSFKQTGNPYQPNPYHFYNQPSAFDNMAFDHFGYHSPANFFPAISTGPVQQTRFSSTSSLFQPYAEVLTQSKGPNMTKQGFPSFQQRGFYGP